ncbi:MAG: copper resistance protein B [Alteraurantiacibacter sp.]
MMRALMLAGAALVATPAMAQDHSGHHPPPAETPAEAEQTERERREDAQANPLSQIRTAPRPVARPAEPAHDHAEMDHAVMNHGAMDHGALDHGAMDIPTVPPPPRAFEGPTNAADAIWGEDRMVAARGENRASHGDQRFATFLMERLEASFADGEESYAWDAQGWYGTPLEKLVVKTEGEGDFSGGVEEAELQLLWGHAIGPWFDLQAGFRLDVEPGTAAHGVLGVAGLAPYMVHVDAAAFLSDDGDLTARIEAEHDMRLTQRLVLQPRAEVELAAQDIVERDIDAGLYHYSLGARLRYEFVPEFAPYLGVEYAGGDEGEAVALLAGLRFWF